MIEFVSTYKLIRNIYILLIQEQTTLYDKQYYHLKRNKTSLEEC